MWRFSRNSGKYNLLVYAILSRVILGTFVRIVIRVTKKNRVLIRITKKNFNTVLITGSFLTMWRKLKTNTIFTLGGRLTPKELLGVNQPRFLGQLKPKLFSLIFFLLDVGILYNRIKTKKMSTILCRTVGNFCLFVGKTMMMLNICV